MPIPDEFQILNVMSTAGATILGLGYGLCLAYLAWSLFKGGRRRRIRGARRAWSGRRPRRRRTTFNFEEDVIVTEPAYNYQPAGKVHHG